MTSEEIRDLVAAELSNYRYEAPAPGTTIGQPWSAEMIATHVEKLRGALVNPYLQKFVLVDTYEQMYATDKTFVHYWVVAEAEMYCEFYDPDSKDFGLGEPVSSGQIPRTAGVRGDLVGVFCAM